MLFEIYKRLLNLRQNPSPCNLSFLLPQSEAYLLLSQYLQEPNLVKTLPTLILDQIKPLLTSQTCLSNVYETSVFIKCFHVLKIGQQALYSCNEWLSLLQKKCFKSNDVKILTDLILLCRQPVFFAHSSDLTAKHAMLYASSKGYANLS